MYSVKSNIANHLRPFLFGNSGGMYVFRCMLRRSYNLPGLIRQTASVVILSNVHLKKGPS